MRFTYSYGNEPAQPGKRVVQLEAACVRTRTRTIYTNKRGGGRHVELKDHHGSAR